MKRAHHLLVALTACANAALAGSVDTFIGSAEATRIDPGSVSGQSVSADWLRRSDTNLASTAGFELRRIDSTRFATGRAGLNVPVAADIQLGVLLQGGSITEPGDRLASWKQSIEGTYRITPRLFGSVQLQHLQVGGLHGSIASVATDVVLPPRWSLRFGAASSIEGNVDSRHVVARVDYTDVYHLFAGGAVGTSTARLLNLAGASRGTFTDVHAGVGRAFERTSVTLTLRHLRTDVQRQSALNLLFAVPLQRNAGS